MTSHQKSDKAAQPPRKCPECGTLFPVRPGGPGSVQVFCRPACQRRFHNIMLKRGKVAVPFLLVMRMGKNGRTDDTAYALKQASLLADQWNMDDKAAGRDPRLVVANKRARAWTAADVG